MFLTIQQIKKLPFPCLIEAVYKNKRDKIGIIVSTSGIETMVIKDLWMASYGRQNDKIMYGRSSVSYRIYLRDLGYDSCSLDSKTRSDSGIRLAKLDDAENLCNLYRMKFPGTRMIHSLDDLNFNQQLAKMSFSQAAHILLEQS